MYKGKGEHSVHELEKIITQREEELHRLKSTPTTLLSDEEIRSVRNTFVTPQEKLAFNSGLTSLPLECRRWRGS